MKTTHKSNPSDQRGLFIALAILVGLFIIVANEMVHHRFATLGYLALSVISPVLVLFVADLRKFRKVVRH
jgi:hypothetical protein